MDFFLIFIILLNIEAAWIFWQMKNISLKCMKISILLHSRGGCI